MSFSSPAQLDKPIDNSNSRAYLIESSKSFSDDKPLLFYFLGLDETDRDLIDIKIAERIV